MLTDPEHSLVFSRSRNGKSVLVFLNFGEEPTGFSLPNNSLMTGDWRDVFTGEKRNLSLNERVELAPHANLVLENL